MATLQTTARVAQMFQAVGGSAMGGIRERFIREVELELGRNPKGREKAFLMEGTV